MLQNPKARAAAHRVLHFPLRAFLGLEPLWVVVVLGGAIAFAVSRLVVVWILAIVFPEPSLAPVPPQVYVPKVYAVVALFSVVALWWGVALWRTAGRSATFWMIVVRALAFFVVLMGLLAPANMVSYLEREISPPAGVLKR